MRGFSQFGASSNSSLGQNASFINNGSVGLSKQPSTYAVQKQSAAPGANKSAAAAAAASTNRNVISTSSSGAVKPATFSGAGKLPPVAENFATAAVGKAQSFSFETKLPGSALTNGLETKLPMPWPSPQWDPDVPVIQPEVVTLDQVKSLPWDDIVLGTGVCYLKSGEAMKVCPYSLSVEMAMVEMDIQYKLIHTHLVGKSKEPWFVALHPKGKPSSPFLWSHGRWIFDTIPILEELMRRFPQRNFESVMPLKDHMDARKV